ncbi:MAG: OmpA family protein [Thiobacillus sp.]
MKIVSIKKTTVSIVVGAAMAVLGSGLVQAAGPNGYWTDTSGKVWKNSYGECWKAGYWTPAMAIPECDPNLVKKPEPAKVVEAPAPAPAPVGPEKPAFEKITLQAETLFDFDKSVIHPEGKQHLNNEVVTKMKQYPQVEAILVTGHADRIGTDAYNQALSERRANAVKNYLVSQGIEAGRIQTAAKGESEPVVACNDVKGKESSKNKPLIACLQPNRRVVVEVEVQRPTQK